MMAANARRRLARRNEGGSLLLEAAVWIVPLGTIFLVGFALMGFYHDFNALKGISDSMLRESWGRPLRLYFSDGKPSVGVAREELITMMRSVVARANEEAVGGLFRVSGFSARVCYWVHEVDAFTGRLGRRLEERCEQSGAAGASIQFDAVLARQATRIVGIPLSETQGVGNGGSAYLDRVVIVGAGVSGEYTGLGTYMANRKMTFADAYFPRQELGL